MIDDLDRTLEELLRRELPAELLEHVAITFATPDGEFPPSSVTLPAVDLFLYDVRENTELRTTDWFVDHAAAGTTTRQRPPLRVDCSYLVTAWASDSAPNPAQDEHHLLGEVLRALLRYPELPEPILQGTLRGQSPALPTSALQPSQLQSWGDFWQAIGGKPKAALNFKVTVALDVGPPLPAVPAVRDAVFDVRRAEELP